MAINSDHASEILKRVFDCQDPKGQIELVSGKDKRRFWIHRDILNAASKNFAVWFVPSFEKPEEFVLDDFDGGTIRAVVNFCYTGNIDLTEENEEKCLKMAFCLEIDLLLKKYLQFSSAKLSVANVVDILMIADKYRIGDLRERALKSICESFAAVPSLNIQKLSHGLLQDLLKCDKIQEQGDMCAQRLLEWFRCDEEKRGVHMPTLLKLIRLERVTVEFLIEPLEDVFIRFKCPALMYDEFKRRATNQCVSESVPRKRRATSECVSESATRQRVNSVSRTRSIFIVPRDVSEELQIKKYNIASNCFENLANLPKLQSSKIFGVAVYENKMFIMGATEFDNSVFSYDLFSGETKTLTKFKERRTYFSTISIENYIYVIGGTNGSRGSKMNLFERFDMKKNTWSTLKSMNDARSSAAATVLNGCIYVAGGDTELNVTTCSVELYDPKNDEWRYLESMKKDRYWFALTELNGFLYAMGHRQSIERFDPNLNKWTQLGSFDESNQIFSSIAIARKLFAIKKTGDFGRVDVDACGKCSFNSLHQCESKFCLLLLND